MHHNHLVSFLRWIAPPPAPKFLIPLYFQRQMNIIRLLKYIAKLFSRELIAIYIFISSVRGSPSHCTLYCTKYCNLFNIRGTKSELTAVLFCSIFGYQCDGDFFFSHFKMLFACPLVFCFKILTFVLWPLHCILWLAYLGDSSHW